MKTHKLTEDDLAELRDLAVRDALTNIIKVLKSRSEYYDKPEYILQLLETIIARLPQDLRSC